MTYSAPAPTKGDPLKAAAPWLTFQASPPVRFTASSRPPPPAPALLSVPTTRAPWQVRCAGVEVANTSPLELAGVVSAHSSMPEEALKEKRRRPTGSTTAPGGEAAAPPGGRQPVPSPSRVGEARGTPVRS